MSAVREWVSRLGASLLPGRPGRHDRDLEDELRTHLEFAAEDARRNGVPRATAERAASLQLGGLSQSMEAVRDQRGLRWLTDVRRDARYACRMLLRSPGLTTVAVATLALGIGANVTIFSVADALLLRPLPVADPSSLVRVHTNNFSATPYSDYVQYRDRTRTLAALTAFQIASMSLRVDDVAEHVLGMMASGNYFETIGVGAARGRTLVEADDQLGAPGAALLSDGFWRRRFGADPAVVGRSITINGTPFTIVGVTAPAFTGTMAPLVPDVWVAWNATRLTSVPDDSRRTSTSAQLMGRLAPGHSRLAAQTELTTLAAGLAAQSPDANHSTRMSVYAARPLAPEFWPQAALFIGLLMTLVSLVLLIACVNIASLLLARSTARRREIATRLALGASRRRLVNQLLVESAVISALGGLAAVAVAFAATRMINAVRLPVAFPIGLALAVDRRVLLFAVALSIVTTLLCGLAPALRASRGDLVAALKDGGDGRGHDRSRLRAGLIVGQVAMSTLLLVIAGLLIRSVVTAQALSRGFSVDGVLLANLDLDTRGYTPDRGNAFFSRLLEEIEQTPGVASASIVSIVPLSLSNSTTRLLKDGQESPERGAGLPVIYGNEVSPGHFRTLEIPLLSGRDFDSGDRSGAPDVAIVNETLARRLWPGESAVGRRVREWRGREAPGSWLEVVGVARDSKYVTVGEDPKAFIYRPLAQVYTPGVTLMVKSQRDPMSVAASVRDRVKALDRDLPVFGVTTLAAATGVSLLPVRVAAWLAMALGVVAVALAAIGLYGVMSYLARRRTREIGIRMALGAQPSSVVRLVARQGLRWTATALVIGLVASVAVTRVLTGLLYGVAPLDLVVFIVVPLTLAITAYAACSVPGRWASRVDPLTALRVE